VVVQQRAWLRLGSHCTWAKVGQSASPILILFRQLLFINNRGKTVRIRTILFFVVVLTLLPIALYLGKFGFASFDQQSDWAEFGTYLGGVLGPIYALLAFLGLLTTIRLQSKQLVDFQKSAQFEELQEMLASVSTAIEAKLDAIPPYTILRFKDPKTVPTLGGLLNGTCYIAHQLHIIDSMPSLDIENLPVIFKETISSNRQYVADVKNDVSPELYRLFAEIDNLAWCCMRYRQKGGSSLITEFYLRKHIDQVLAFDSIGGFVEPDSEIAVFFEIDDKRKVALASMALHSLGGKSGLAELGLKLTNPPAHQ
jgi:hypothetical protein